MESRIDIEVVVLEIPSLGTCTLVPSYKELHFRNHTYEAITCFAEALGLTELSELRHHQIQEVFKAVSYILSGSNLRKEVEFGIILSGAHDSYTSIYTDAVPQETKKRKCVTLMDFCTWNNKDGKLTDVPSPNHFEMILDELPVEENFNTPDKNILFTLFLGAYNPENE
jgi:hypothetical protein